METLLIKKLINYKRASQQGDKASLDGCPAGACGIVMSRFPCRTGKAGPLVRIPA
jgi:hypothetical protein